MIKQIDGTDLFFCFNFLMPVLLDSINAMYY